MREKLGLIVYGVLFVYLVSTISAFRSRSIENYI